MSETTPETPSEKTPTEAAAPEAATHLTFAERLRHTRAAGKKSWDEALGRARAYFGEDAEMWGEPAEEEPELEDQHSDEEQQPDANTFLGLESAALRERRQMEARTRRERLAYSTQIGSILKLHNPKMIDSLPDLLRRYEGREKELLTKIESRYGLRSAGFKANPQK